MQTKDNLKHICLPTRNKCNSRSPFCSQYLLSICPSSFTQQVQYTRTGNRHSTKTRWPSSTSKHISYVNRQSVRVKERNSSNKTMHTYSSFKAE